MTFREGCFIIRNWMQVLKWRSWDFLSPLILQKMKEDNISQLGDYDVSFCVQQYTHGSCYISSSNFKSFDQFNTPQTAWNFRHLLNCGTIVGMLSAHPMRLHYQPMRLWILLCSNNYILSTLKPIPSGIYWNDKAPFWQEQTLVGKWIRQFQTAHFFFFKPESFWYSFEILKQNINISWVF